MKKILFSALLFVIFLTEISYKSTVKANKNPNYCNTCSGLGPYIYSKFATPTRHWHYSPNVATSRQPRLMPSIRPSYLHPVSPLLFLDYSGHLASYDPRSQWIHWNHPIHRQLDHRIDQIFNSMWPYHNDYFHHPNKHVTESSQTKPDESSLRDDLTKQTSNEEVTRKLNTRENTNTIPNKKNPNTQNTAKSQVESSNNKNHPHSIEIFRLEVSNDYEPDEISIKTEGNQIYIHGKKTCKCSESCLEREFERKITLPKGFEVKSLKATLDNQGVLRIAGHKPVGLKPTVNGMINTELKVEGIGLEGKEKSTKCSEFKRGIKLKKMNKMTGEVFAEEDIPSVEDDFHSNLRPEVDDRNKQEHTDDDDVTIEAF